MPPFITPVFTPQALEYLTAFHAVAESGAIAAPVFQRLIAPRPGENEFRIVSQTLNTENANTISEGVKQVLAEATRLYAIGSKNMVPHTEGFWKIHRSEPKAILFEGRQRQFAELREEYLHVGCTTEAPVKLCASMVIGLERPLSMRPAYTLQFPMDHAITRSILTYLFPQGSNSPLRHDWAGEVVSASGRSYQVQIRKNGSGYRMKVKPSIEAPVGLESPLIDYWKAIESAVLSASGIIFH